MALMRRVSRLFRADVNALLDRIEEPALLLRQAVRDMDEALVRDQQALQQLDRRHDRLTARQAELDRSFADLEHDLDLCFEAGEEALARTLVRRKLEAERLGRHLARQRESLEQALAERHARLETDRGRLEAMRQKAELFADELADEADDGFEPELGAMLRVRDQEVEIALLKERQRRAGP